MENQWEYPFTTTNNCPYPIFRQDLSEISLFYTPGYLAVAEHHYADKLNDQLCSPTPSLFIAKRLLERSLLAEQQWADMFREQPFTPLCLTLYTSQRCNLECIYCFSQTETAYSGDDLDLDYIEKAAEEVAINCEKARVPFTLVIHGGGEPILDPRLPDILNKVKAIAKRKGLGCFFYLATNGVMSEEKARWAAQQFDEIGLSCDGPSSIQAAQRPLKGGGSSTPLVEQTAAIIRDAGKPLHIRATITAQSIDRMPEIAAYLCGTLRASEVRIESVYQNELVPSQILTQAEEAKHYCVSFFKARRIAAKYGSRWVSSGSRLGEIHGRYCQIFKNVLHLIPGNGVSACFKVNSRNHAQSLAMEIGSHHNGSFEINHHRVRELQQILAADSPTCNTCFNRFHCARGCPDDCPAELISPEKTYRCELNRMMATALLQERARKLIPALQQNPIIGSVIQGAL